MLLYDSFCNTANVDPVFEHETSVIFYRAKNTMDPV